MKILTEDADLRCDHQNGKVKIEPSQTLVRIDGRLVLVEHDPEAKGISGCPNYGVMIKPCTTTLAVKEGYSTFMTIDGRRVCLDTVTGLTDGMPPGMVNYIVRDPGQKWVDEKQ